MMMDRDSLTRPVSFPEWTTVLAAEGFDLPKVEQYRRSIVAYLHHLKERRARASLDSARQYVEASEAKGLTGEQDREALRWFFTAERRRRESPAAGGVEAAASRIVPEKADRGATPWEQRLVERLRVGQYQWRTEMTYRDWVWRLATWMTGRAVDEATEEDLKGFLSHLAVDRAVAAATQRQALNALVFFFREVLGREPGDLAGYTPSRRPARVPVVLTQAECARIFSQELLGHSDVETTMIYTHALNRPGVAVKSPLDSLPAEGGSGPEPA